MANKKKKTTPYADALAVRTAQANRTAPAARPTQSAQGIPAAQAAQRKNTAPAAQAAPTARSVQAADPTPQQSLSPSPGTANAAGASTPAETAALAAQSAPDPMLALLSTPTEDTAYRRALEAADSAYARALAGYGSQAAALAARGLTDSGYARYLDRLAYEGRQKSIDAAAATRQSAAAERQSQYAAWLSKLAQAQQKAQAAAPTQEEQAAAAEQKRINVLGKLIAADLTDPAAAVPYAMVLGLDEDTARQTAEMARLVLVNNDTHIRNVLLKCIQYGYFGSGAEKLAQAFGLSEEAAKKVRELIDRGIVHNSYWDIRYDNDGYVPDDGSDS